MPDSDKTLFTVTDLKQYAYCKRILYYHTCLPDIRPVTRKMQMGIHRHEDEHKRSLRRSMHLPEIDQAGREFDVTVQSSRLGLSGQVDELIFMDDRLIPVDYKLAKRVGNHFKLQLTAYAMMAEATFGLPVSSGLIYLIRTRRTVEVPISTHWRRRVTTSIEEMRDVVLKESMPDPTSHRRSCVDCEFRRFCNDV